MGVEPRRPDEAPGVTDPLREQAMAAGLSLYLLVHALVPNRMRGVFAGGRARARAGRRASVARGSGTTRSSRMLALGALLCALGARASSGQARAAAPIPRAVAHASPSPTTALTFEPLGPILARAFAVELEQRLSPGWSLAIQPAALFASHGVSDAEGAVRTEEAIVWSASLHARAYLLGDGLDGLFVGPVVTWTVGGFRPSAGDARPMAIAAGGLIGYSLVLGGTFLLSTGAGAQYHARVDGDRSRGDDRAVPLLRLAIGAAF
jgi:hypothetical protein